MIYSDIQDIFDKMMFITYEFQAQGAKSLRLDISSVKLETMRIVEQDVDNSGLLVPVWNFYGTRKMCIRDSVGAAWQIHYRHQYLRQEHRANRKLLYKLSIECERTLNPGRDTSAG